MRTATYYLLTFFAMCKATEDTCASKCMTSTGTDYTDCVICKMHDDNNSTRDDDSDIRARDNVIIVLSISTAIFFCFSLFMLFIWRDVNNELKTLLSDPPPRQRQAKEDAFPPSQAERAIRQTALPSESRAVDPVTRAAAGKPPTNSPRRAQPSQTKEDIEDAIPRSQAERDATASKRMMRPLSVETEKTSPRGTTTKLGASKRV